MVQNLFKDTSKIIPLITYTGRYVSQKDIALEQYGFRFVEAFNACIEIYLLKATSVRYCNKKMQSCTFVVFIF